MLIEKFLIIFGAGVFILVGAILLNLLAGFFGIITWHGFLISLIENGLKEFLSSNIFFLLFLFVIYPFLLGLIGYLFFDFFN